MSIKDNHEREAMNIDDAPAARDTIARALFLSEHPDSEGAWDAPGELGKGHWLVLADAVLAVMPAPSDAEREGAIEAVEKAADELWMGSIPLRWTQWLRDRAAHLREEQP